MDETDLNNTKVTLKNMSENFRDMYCQSAVLNV